MIHTVLLEYLPTSMRPSSFKYLVLHIYFSENINNSFITYDNILIQNLNLEKYLT